MSDGHSCWIPRPMTCFSVAHSILAEWASAFHPAFDMGRRINFQARDLLCVRPAAQKGAALRVSGGAVSNASR